VSNSNVIDLRKWRDETAASQRAYSKCFASTREIQELLQAFTRIESPLFRTAIIRTARKVSSDTPSEPPKSTA